MKNKNELICERCGGELEVGDSYCAACGENLTEGMYACDCGERFHIITGMAFCYGCGKPIANQA